MARKWLYARLEDDWSVLPDSEVSASFEKVHKWQTVSCADKMRVETTICPIVNVLEDYSRNLLISESNHQQDEKILRRLLAKDDSELRFR